MNYEPELAVALAAAEAAGGYLRGAYEAFIPIPDAPVGISTEADRTSQDMILHYLAQAYPDDAQCAEEGTATLAAAKHDGPRRWVVDPIDGTRGFAMKTGEFSVMIGLVEHGRVVVGVVLEPALSRVTYARRGGGCWWRTGDGSPVAVRVTTTADLTAAVLAQSHSKTGESSGPRKKLRPARVVETYSAGVKLAMVARGEADLYVNTYENFRDWDICAGDLLVTEAGGTVTELNGEPIAYGRPSFAQRGGLLASNGRLHAAAIAGLRSPPP